MELHDAARIALMPTHLGSLFIRELREMSAQKARANCKAKLRFRSRAAARNAEILRLSRAPAGSTKGRPYECKVCGHWHITTS